MYLEKGMSTHSNILAWKIPWTEESGRLQSLGSQRVRHGSLTNTHTQYMYIIYSVLYHKTTIVGINRQFLL